MRDGVDSAALILTLSILSSSNFYQISINYSFF